MVLRKKRFKNLRMQILYLVFLIHLVRASRKLKYNYIYCRVLDEDIAEVHHCRVKIISRQMKSIQMKVTLKRTITKAIMHFRCMQKLNGWRPFMFDYKAEVCDISRNLNKYVVTKFGYDLIRHATNVNHSCPYKKGETLILDLQTYDEKRLASVLSLFPLDTGEYGAFVSFYIDNKLIGDVNVSMIYSDYSKLYK